MKRTAFITSLPAVITGIVFVIGIFGFGWFQRAAPADGYVYDRNYSAAHNEWVPGHAAVIYCGKGCFMPVFQPGYMTYVPAEFSLKLCLEPQWKQDKNQFCGWRDVSSDLWARSAIGQYTRT